MAIPPTCGVVSPQGKSFSTDRPFWPIASTGTMRNDNRRRWMLSRRKGHSTPRVVPPPFSGHHPVSCNWTTPLLLALGHPAPPQIVGSDSFGVESSGWLHRGATVSRVSHR